MSSGPHPDNTSKKAAASATVRANGPTTPSSPSPGGIGSSLTRPRLGLIPTSPVTLAGIRIDPPPSDPCATDASRADTAAAAPPLDPPAERARSQGVRATCPRPFSV